MGAIWERRMKTKTWETLDYVDLALMFGRSFSVDIKTGRDAALLKNMAQQHGLNPLQVLYGFLVYKDTESAKYVHAFCLNVGLWKCDDPLEAAAEVKAHVTSTTLPIFFWDYLDLRVGGDGSALSDAAFAAAKSKLEAYLYDWLRSPLKVGDRALFAQRDATRTITFGNTSGFRDFS